MNKKIKQDMPSLNRAKYKEEFIAKYQKDNNGTIISFKTLLDENPIFAQCINSINGRGNIEDYFIILKHDDGRYSTLIYSNRYKYHLSSRLPTIGKDDDHDYLGCTVSNRIPNVGENWHRGNDLADGSLSMVTWDKIMRDIIRHEMEKLECF